MLTTESLREGVIFREIRGSTGGWGFTLPQELLKHVNMNAVTGRAGRGETPGFVFIAAHFSDCVSLVCVHIQIRQPSQSSVIVKRLTFPLRAPLPTSLKY